VSLQQLLSGPTAYSIHVGNGATGGTSARRGALAFSQDLTRDTLSLKNMSCTLVLSATQWRKQFNQNLRIDQHHDNCHASSSLKTPARHRIGITLLLIVLYKMTLAQALPSGIALLLHIQ
jgi:hypothetical protein